MHQGQKLAPGISHLHQQQGLHNWDNCLHAWHSPDNQNSLLTWVPTKNTRSKTETADKASQPAALVPGIHCWAPPTRQSQETGIRHADACAISILQSLHSLYYQLQTSPNPSASRGDPPHTPYQLWVTQPAQVRTAGAQLGSKSSLRFWRAAVEHPAELETLFQGRQAQGTSHEARSFPMCGSGTAWQEVTCLQNYIKGSSGICSY